MNFKIRILIIICFLAIVMPSCNQKAEIKNPKSESTSEFDQDLAETYGADDYGMKKYVMAFLKSGPTKETDPAKANEIQAAHMENIGRLANEGKLAVAGPFLDNGDLRGIYIFNVETLAEAEALTLTDPAIKKWCFNYGVKGILLFRCVNGCERNP